MDNTQEAAGVAPAPQTEATPNTNIEQTQAPSVDMHGFTSEQLAEMRKFYDANGGFEKIKSKISNPTPVQAQPAQSVQDEQPTQQARPAVQPEQPAYRAPEGSISAQEFLTKQYFNSLANNEAYAPIANEIRNGSLLKEMASFNIQPLNEDGSINDGMVRRYLDLKAQTITAKQTSVAPEMSAAPTVDYIPVGEQITDLSQAYAVLRQDTQLKASGQAGHPSIAKAEEFIKNSLSKR